MRMRSLDNSSVNNNKKEINKLLKNPPKSWKKMFRSEGISETPTITEVLSLLGITAGGNPSSEATDSANNPKDLKPPSKVREEAMKGVLLSHEFDYPSYRGIGLARGIQLATQPTIWKNSAERMDAFFKRNARYESLPDFGNDENPSKSYLAWLNWGGSSGRDWVESLDL